MKEIKVQEIMIQISKCLKVRKDHSLIEVFKALDQIRTTENDAAHKDAIVLDESGGLIGKVTMIDIFRALEPRYGQVQQQQKMLQDTKINIYEIGFFPENKLNIRLIFEKRKRPGLRARARAPHSDSHSENHIANLHVY